MIVVLMGYMASGKSTIGQVLAHKLQFDFIDLDQYIEGIERRAIEDIFKDSGEIYFRKNETLHLKQILESKDNLVLSLGGGTPCYGQNLELILSSDHVISIYLKVAIHTLVERLKNEPNKRPLIAHLNTDEELLEFIGKHLFERAQYYSQATFTINSTHSNENDLIEDIIFKLF